MCVTHKSTTRRRPGQRAEGEADDTTDEGASPATFLLFLPFERTRRLRRRPQQVARTVPFLPSISLSISHFSHPYAGERCCRRISAQSGATPLPPTENATRANERIEGKPCIQEMSIRPLGDNPPDPCPLPPPGGGLGKVGEGRARKPTLARISAPAPPPQTPPQSPDNARETRANSRACSEYPETPPSPDAVATATMPPAAETRSTAPADDSRQTHHHRSPCTSL